MTPKITKEDGYIIFECPLSSGSYPVIPYTFNLYLEMPGKIVDSNADKVEGNKAEWHFTPGSKATKIYAKSEVPLIPGFEAIIAIIAVISALFLRHKVKD